MRLCTNAFTTDNIILYLFLLPFMCCKMPRISGIHRQWPRMCKREKWRVKKKRDTERENKKCHGYELLCIIHHFSNTPLSIYKFEWMLKILSNDGSILNLIESNTCHLLYGVCFCGVNSIDMYNIKYNNGFKWPTRS